MPYEAIQDLENLLRERVSEATGSPFIAHYDVPVELEQAALKEIVNTVQGTLRNFFGLMPNYPCVCARVLATSLAESYGDAGDKQVYGLIARRLRIGETIPLHQRHALRDRFRHCCLAMGLALPPRTSGRMVDDYLFQAGVSHSQLPMLALAFRRAEKLYGLPRDDDTKQVDDWEDRAVEFAPPGLTVLRRIVREDPTGFHATAFIRLRRESLPSHASKFERAFKHATDSPASSAQAGTSSDPRPSLEFADGDLWVALPRGAKRLEVAICERVQPLSGGRRLALPLPWPAEVSWRRPSSNASPSGWQPFRLFPDPLRILVFDGDSGAFKCDLDPAEPSGQRVPAGQICLLSQSPFEANGEQCGCLGSDAFVLFCEVSTHLIVRQGSLSCEVDVDPRLRLEVDGVRIVRNRDAWLLAGPTGIRVWGDRGSGHQDLELRVRHPALEGDLLSPVRTDSNNGRFASLDMPNSGEFGMARASLHVKGQERALYRTKFWFWPGLRQLVHGRVFDAASIPENLAEENLSHIARGGHGHLALLEGEAYLWARLCFRLNRGIVEFKFHPPGASLATRRSDGVEHPLRKGSSLAVRDDYASCLIVRYPDPIAAIDFKGIVIPRAFGKLGSWRVSFAALKQEGQHNAVRLLPDGNLGSAVDLVRVVPQTEPRHFEARRIGVRQIFQTAFERPINAVRIDAQNLISGETLNANLPLGDSLDEAEGPLLVKVFRTNASDDTERVQIELAPNECSEGVWFVSFAIREDNRDDWLPVINSFGQCYATCTASETYLLKLAADSLSEWCPTGRSQAFLRLSRVIETSVSRECRSHVIDLSLDAWRQLGKSLVHGSLSDQSSLLKACVLPPSPHVREDWLPLHHPVEIAPDLFALPAEELGELASHEVSGYEAFESVGLAGITESLGDAVDVLDISSAFLLGFENAARLQMDSSAPPGRFHFSRYYQAAIQLGDLGDDKPLSISHHDRACERFADRVMIVSMGSSGRLGKAMKVMQHFVPNSNVALDVPAYLREGFALVQRTPPMLGALVRACRYGNASDFWRDLASQQSMQEERVRKYVGSILRLAPELLAFYLLLWVLVERNSE